ncbi:MAG: PucR family transcriptional regulator, partial [Solirubrobacteraceae bacterium]
VRVVHFEDVRASAVLLELLEVAGDHPSWRVGKVQALLEHDREHGTGYADTLRAYLDHWGDVAATARALGLHPNTLRYRVRRLVELSGLDLDDPEERLVAELQVRLLVGDSANPGRTVLEP